MISASDEPFEDEFENSSETENQRSTADRRGKAVDDVHKLGMWQGVALLTADCLGVGILALPEDIHVLGRAFGLLFLLLQLPINYYAGYILAWTASQVENDWWQSPPDTYSRDDNDTEQALEMTGNLSKSKEDDVSNSENPGEESSGFHGSSSPNLQPLRPWNRYLDLTDANEEIVQDSDQLDASQDPIGASNIDGTLVIPEDCELEEQPELHQSPQSFAREPPPTFDLIGISSAVFSKNQLDEINSTSMAQRSSGNKIGRNVVILLYYMNIFLVLGDYILVMAHAVAAVWEGMCITTAGLVASILMFAICQLNTMALLGQYVSMASLAALAIVLGQCIWEANQSRSEEESDVKTSDKTDQSHTDSHPSVLRKFSALASICFAVGSQKLFLNIRYELADKEKDASPVLARSLTIYFMAYFAVILLAGPDPPSFLFNTIPKGSWNRRIAGLLLWGHVAVSYAINSQALCSSLQRVICNLSNSSRSTGRLRWLLLTLIIAVSSYLVANGIPFFKDLVALIGAATTVPLTLTLPPVLYQHWQQWTRLSNILRRRADFSNSGVIQRTTTRNLECMSSSALLLYSVVFLGIGLAGSLASVKRDWADSGRPPFSCDQS